MNNDLELPIDDRSETNIINIPSESSSGGMSVETGSSLESTKEFNLLPDSTISVVSFNKTERLFELIKGFNDFPDSTTSVFSVEKSWLSAFPVERIIPPKVRQLPETDWFQDFEYSSYRLRQLTPILIEREDNVVNATYDDIPLDGMGSGMHVAISYSCTKIVAYSEELKVSVNRSGDLPVENYHSNLPLKNMFRQIMGDVEPKEWQELKQVYEKKLEEIPYVQKGYIKIDSNDADVIIVLSEESVETIEQLAEIDLEINLQFRPLYFFVEYESSEDYLDLDDFERFY